MVDRAPCHYADGDHCGRIGVAVSREEGPCVRPGSRTWSARWPVNGRPATTSTSISDLLATNDTRRREWWLRHRRTPRTALTYLPSLDLTLRTGRHWTTIAVSAIGDPTTASGGAHRSPVRLRLLPPDPWFPHRMVGTSTVSMRGVRRRAARGDESPRGARRGTAAGLWAAVTDMFSVYWWHQVCAVVVVA
jgi:hypothetical protein